MTYHASQTITTLFGQKLNEMAQIYGILKLGDSECLVLFVLAWKMFVFVIAVTMYTTCLIKTTRALNAAYLKILHESDCVFLVR